MDNSRYAMIGLASVMLGVSVYHKEKNKDTADDENITVALAAVNLLLQIMLLYMEKEYNEALDKSFSDVERDFED